MEIVEDSAEELLIGAAGSTTNPDPAKAD